MAKDIIYNFDETVKRRGTSCFKWDELQSDDAIPMWVADMDFRAAPEIQKAIEERINHGVFGYAMVPDSYHEAVNGWFQRRNAFSIPKEQMLYTTGVVPAISAIVKALAKPGDGVILQTPVYNCFFSSVRNNGCQVVENPLIQDENGWRMDYDDLERKAAEERVKLLILCNPHNPVGRVWTQEELEKLNDICLRHGVKVVADEIHCGLIMPGYKYIPFASISQKTADNSISCNSASKSFNIAGLHLAYIFTNDQKARKLIDRAININEVCDVNPLGIVAQTAAYNEGDEWLSQLCNYIHENYEALCIFMQKELPQIKISRLEGTYLVWADIKALGIPSDIFTERLEKEAKVKVSSGTIYGTKTGEGFVRINLACPKTQMEEALKRIADFVHKL